MKKVLLIVHQETSDPGLVGTLLRDFGYWLDIRCPSLQQDLPATMENHDAVVVFGGPMSANDSDTLPFIRAELDWISVVLNSGKPYLGICLGAQLLARVLGATVAPHPDRLTEIGYFSITPTPTGQAYFPTPMKVYHWHREGFELPRDAVLLAQGNTFENQAYRYGNHAYGVQFHPEITRTMMEGWTTRGSELLSLPGAQPCADHFRGHALYALTVRQWLESFLRQWLGLAPRRAVPATLSLNSLDGAIA